MRRSSVPCGRSDLSAIVYASDFYTLDRTRVEGQGIKQVPEFTYLIAPALNISERSSATAAAPSQGYPALGSTSKISCMVRRVDECENSVALANGSPFTFARASFEMIMNGSVNAGVSPPSLSSHHSTITPLSL